MCVHSLFAAHDFSRLPDIVKPIPYCEGKVQFDVAKDYFVEIANPLPGVQDYNELIKFYQRKDWVKFNSAVEQYKQIYETTPLLEAVQFLEVQAKYEQIDRTDYNQSLEAEKFLKQAILLYPKSELVGVITASVASLLLKDGLIQKALSLFQKAKTDFVFHPLSCLFQLGSGESNFLMHDYTSAKRDFNQVRQKCSERKYNVGALVRLNDIELRKQGIGFLNEYEKPFYSDVNIVGRFYPFILFNLGEIKFRKKEYSSSKMFFTEFAKYGGKDPVCGPLSLKRLADISLLTGEKLDTVIGKYFSVREQAPLTDIGRYSYVHGFFLNFANVSEVEQVRRLKLCDDEIDKIQDYELRSLAFLEKGLVMLSTGKKEALEYLLKLNQRANFDLKNGELAEFVREQVMNFLEKEAYAKLEKTKRVDTLHDNSILSPYEEVYETWIKGTHYDAQAKNLYEKILIKRFELAMEKKDGLAAIAKLDRWKKSSLWNPKGLTKKQKKMMGDSVAVYLKGLSDEDLKDLSGNLKKYRDTMEYVFNPEYHLLLVALDLPNVSKDEILSHYNTMKKERSLASVDSNVSAEARTYLFRVKGKMLSEIGRLSEAEDAFLRAQDKQQKVAVQKELLHLYEVTKKYPSMLNISLQMMSGASPEDQLVYLDNAKTAVSLGKLWKSSEALYTQATKAGLKDKDLTPFTLLVARASYEMNKCKVAIQKYKELVKEELPSEENAGSKFRYAKCLSREKKSDEALKYFEEVIAMNDSFWTPLASTEKKLLEMK